MTRVVEAFGGTPAEWDSFVRRQSHWTHCHLHGWKGIMERVLGHECVHLAVRDDGGALAGVLPLVRIRSLLFGSCAVSMPFLNYGGPLGSREAVAALGAHAVAWCRKEKLRLELRSRIPLDVPLSPSSAKVTALLDLPEEGAEALWRNFPSKLRSQIRRPRKEGVSVRFGRDQVEPFFSVFSHHMRDLGTPTLPRDFFRAVAGTFGEDAWFACAYHQGRPVAAGCSLRTGAEIELNWAAAHVEHRSLSANMLLYWSFMERACEEGVQRFDFGRCTPGSGTHRFKQQWGPREIPLWWYCQGSRDTPSPDVGAYAWGPRLWRHLPLPLATALGPRIRRVIPL